MMSTPAIAPRSVAAEPSIVVGELSPVKRSFLCPAVRLSGCPAVRLSGCWADRFPVPSSQLLPLLYMPVSLVSRSAGQLGADDDEVGTDRQTSRRAGEGRREEEQEGGDGRLVYVSSVISMYNRCERTCAAGHSSSHHPSYHHPIIMYRPRQRHENDMKCRICRYHPAPGPPLSSLLYDVRAREADDVSY
jgi:hypothetical protein